MAKREFRAHVEGLRAFAVMPILLFHLDPRWCPGGFVGVDIFFVISGYLITGVILADATRFGFARFYVRRLFRLLPALLITLIATLIAGWYVLSPVDYVGLSYSALSATTAISNVYFLATVDYFNASSVMHPLLHTWSLAVEEQFYLVWPALVVLWVKRGWPTWLLLVGISVVSFAAMLGLQPAEPEAVFYLMPFRMFELSIGACLVLLEGRWQRVGAAGQAATGVIGSVFLAISLVVIDGNTPWPSVWSLLPTAATALVILAGGTGICAKILEHAVPRFFGRISYSLYLVHWPLVTLYRAYAITEPTTLELAGLGLASVIIGALLFGTVELTFRQSNTRTALGDPEPRLAGMLARVFSLRAKAALLGLLTLIVLGGAAAIAGTGGVPSRLERGRVQILDKGLTFAGDLCSFKRSRCVFGDREATDVVHLLGDSLALNWVHGLDRLFREVQIKGVALYDHGCLYAYQTKRFNSGTADERCRKNVDEAYSYLAQNRLPVILAGNWIGYVHDIGPADAKAPLRHDEPGYFAYLEQRLVAGLERIGAGERAVVLVKQPYSTGVDIAKCLSQPGVGESAKASRCVAQSRSHALRSAAEADRMIENVVRRFPSIVTIDPKVVFCRDEVCKVSDEGALYFRDTGHLTNEGSLFMVAGVRETLLKVFRGKP